MYISLSDGVDISLLGTTIFADDDTFNEYEIHLGLVGLLIQQASLKENLFLEMNCTLLAQGCNTVCLYLKKQQICYLLNEGRNCYVKKRKISTHNQL